MTTPFDRTKETREMYRARTERERINNEARAKVLANAIQAKQIAAHKADAERDNQIASYINAESKYASGLETLARFAATFTACLFWLAAIANALLFDTQAGGLYGGLDCAIVAVLLHIASAIIRSRATIRALAASRKQ
ncbi:MAG: hypothetical protein AMXMBFR84_37410 [Candidatus Hydrogenedentota bacterium]